MASLVLSGDTSGSITVSAPAVSGSNTQTLVAVTGTLAPIVSGTAVTASGSSVDFTGIPSWVKRITVMFSGVSLTGTDTILIQVGTSSGLVSTGYINGQTGVSTSTTNTTGGGTAVAGFSLGGISPTAGTLIYGQTIISNLTGNTWIATSNFYASGAARVGISAGVIELSAALDRLSLVASGANTFDAGTINILYE